LKLSELNILIGFSAFALTACASSAEVGKNVSGADADGSAGQVLVEAKIVCPEGTRLNSFPRVCVTRGGFALGPFPLELQEACRQQAPQDAATCVQKQDWPFELLMSLVALYKRGCPPGTSPEKSGVCIGADSLYGPFTLQQVMACRAGVSLIQQGQCNEVVWPPDFLKFVKNNTEGSDVSRVSSGLESSENKSGLMGADSKIGSVSNNSHANALGTKANNVSGSDLSSRAPVDVKTDKSTENLSKKESETGAGETSTVEKTNMRQALEKPVLAQQPLAPLQEQLPQAPTYCVYSWDEVPGTADFTTIDRRARSAGRVQSYLLDRKENETLLGNKDFQALDVCARARFLKGCFHRVLFGENTPGAQTFRAWSLGRVRPMEAHMAFVMAQTRLGLWHDECSRGRCKGVGFSRVEIPRTNSGKRIHEGDVLWRGITHNIVSNLRFGLRWIAAKAALGPADLYQLARISRPPGAKADEFARDVDKYYRQLNTCQLD
jgi:hypothetical protein